MIGEDLANHTDLRISVLRDLRDFLDFQNPEISFYQAETTQGAMGLINNSHLPAAVPFRAEQSEVISRGSWRTSRDLDFNFQNQHLA